MSEHTFEIVNHIIGALAVLLIIVPLFFAVFETKNEMDYFQSLLEKVKDGTITEDEHAYLLRKLSRNG